MTNILRPRGVTAPMAGAHNTSVPGLGSRAQNPYGTQTIDPLAQLRSLVDSQSGGAGMPGGTIHWEQYGDSRFEDQALRDLRNESGSESNLDQMFLTKYASATAEFAALLMTRRGVFYEEYRGILENFRINPRTHAKCVIRDEFVTTINRHPELVQGIAKAAAPMYGQRLINIAKNNQSGECTRADYISAVHFSIRNVLVMEMISWLCKHPQGRQRAHSLTEEISGMVKRIEEMKDVFGVACNTFGVTNPYAGLVFDVQLPSRTDTAFAFEAQADYLYENFNTRREQNPNIDHELQAMVSRNAARANQNAYAQQNVQEENDFEIPRWNNPKGDINKITTQNKNKYDLRNYFHYIGRADHYFIKEEDWKRIKHTFNRHPDQPYQEESVLEDCFRIVIIDLERDNGWFSTVVRAKGLRMATILTNPSMLLPLLDAVDNSIDVEISQIAVEKALGAKNKTLEIPLETCNSINGVPVVTVKEPFATTSSKKLNAMVVTSNEHLTQNFKHANAVSFNTTIWETFTCSDVSDKIRLVDDLPFLFKDLEDNANYSFYRRLKILNSYFHEEIVDDEIKDFVSERLTVLVNEWFVSALGYDNDPNSAGHLSVSNIIKDFDDLDKDMEKHDEQGYRIFNAPGGPDNYLTEQMKLFTSVNKYETASSAKGLIQKAQRAQEITLERPLHVVVINKRPGPVQDSGGEPIVIKRSKFPDYFDIVEKSFTPTMGEDLDIKVVDKVIQFSDDDNLWLFTHTSIDRNVATLRPITRRASLLYLSLV